MAICTACTDDSSTTQENTSKARPPAPVVVETITKEPLVKTREFYAEVRAKDDAALSPSAPGEVTEVLVREGDSVEKGDKLVAVNATSATANLRQLRAELSAAKVNLEQARKDAKRARKLAERSVGSVQAAEQAETQASQLEQQLRSIRASILGQRQNVQDHTVRAPFNGVVVSRHVDSGDFVQPGEVVIELVATEELEVFVRLPQKMLASLDAVENVQLTFGDNSIDADIKGVVGVLEESTRSALVRLTPTKNVPWLRPGASIRAEFQVVSPQPGLLVSQDAIVYGVARPRVVIAKDGKAKPVHIQIVDKGGSIAEIKGQGLQAGDQVVVRGNERLRPGQHIKIVPELGETSDKSNKNKHVGDKSSPSPEQVPIKETEADVPSPASPPKDEQQPTHASDEQKEEVAQ